MTYLWHGYAAFQKPTAVTAGNWTTALAALKAELDETPSANQPAERWHSVTNGDTTIVEATFDLAKLNTANLTTVAGVDMTNAWEMMRPIQGWQRSLEKAKSLIVDRAWDLEGYPSFLPESYGTIGVSPAGDMAAVQAAIDAASAAGGGRVICNGVYKMADSGSMTSVLMPKTHYGVWINADNVGIEGSGSFELDGGESYTKPFVGILFGNGGSQSGLPGETGTWIYNNWLKNITITGTEISDEVRTNGFGFGVTSFFYCSDFVVRGVTVIDGWSTSAIFATHASSRYGTFQECDIQSGVCSAGSKFSFWIDGGHYVMVIGCISKMENAIKFQSNLDNTSSSDNTGASQHNYAIANTFDNLGISTGRVAFSVTGVDDCIIVDNIFSSSVGEYFWGVSLVPFATTPAHGLATTDRCIIRGNTFTSAVGSLRPVSMSGLSDNPQTPDVVDVIRLQNAIVESNTFNGFGRRGYFGNSHVTGARFVENTYPTATAYQYNNPDDEVAIVANNTLQ